jgi:hypothetical protein
MRLKNGYTMTPVTSDTTLLTLYSQWYTEKGVHFLTSVLKNKEYKYTIVVKKDRENPTGFSITGNLIADEMDYTGVKDISLSQHQTLHLIKINATEDIILNEFKKWFLDIDHYLIKDSKTGFIVKSYSWCADENTLHLECRTNLTRHSDEYNIDFEKKEYYEYMTKFLTHVEKSQQEHQAKQAKRS